MTKFRFGIYSQANAYCCIWHLVHFRILLLLSNLLSFLVKKAKLLMEASYWEYIINLPLIAFIPGIMACSDITIFIKFIITLIVTCIICMFIYKYFVIETMLGMFLNGKVHKSNHKQKVK